MLHVSFDQTYARRRDSLSDTRSEPDGTRDEHLLRLTTHVGRDEREGQDEGRLVRSGQVTSVRAILTCADNQLTSRSTARHRPSEGRGGSRERRKWSGA
jgi:hypothetical protein